MPTRWLHVATRHPRVVRGADARRGVPYEFDRFSSPGTVTNLEVVIPGGEPATLSPELAGTHPRRLPLDLQVVDFP